MEDELTKREVFAGQIMAAIVTGRIDQLADARGAKEFAPLYAEMAITLADALVMHLENSRLKRDPTGFAG